MFAVLGVALFAIATIVHGAQLFRYRTWYFTPIIIGTIMEVVGYAFRSLSAKVDPYNVLDFVLQYFFIVVAPVFFSAAIYTILSVLINRLGRQYAPLSPRLILIIFITCDVISTIVQVMGAALIGVKESKRESPDMPNHILTAGLAFQVLTFAIFIALTSVFLWRARGHVGSRRKSEMANGPVVRRDFVFAFMLATVMVYLRTCFRLAESAQGAKATLFTHEIYFGCLEFAPIVIAVYVLAIWHPGRCVSRYR